MMSTAEQQVRNRVVNINTQTGSQFTRSCMAIALGKSRSHAAEIAAARWPYDEIAGVLERAATSPTTSTSGGVALLPGTTEFLNLVNPRTVAGRLRRLRRVSMIDGIAVATTAPQFAWIKEGSPVPAGRLEWTPASLPPRKAGGIVIASEDLLKMGNATSEALFRNELVNGIVKFTDTKFLSADAAVADTSPAGLANGANTTASAGNAAADLATLLGGFDSLEDVAVVASEKSAIALAGQGAFRDGLLFGTVPVVLSSAAGNRLIGIDQQRVLFADDGGIEVDSARQAAIQMDTVPTDPPSAATVYVPTWQQNLVALKVLRWLNWQALSGAVRVVTGVTY
jgi:hypothetical protein